MTLPAPSHTLCMCACMCSCLPSKIYSSSTGCASDCGCRDIITASMHACTVVPLALGQAWCRLSHVVLLRLHGPRHEARVCVRPAGCCCCPADRRTNQWPALGVCQYSTVKKTCRVG